MSWTHYAVEVSLGPWNSCLYLPKWRGYRYVPLHPVYPVPRWNPGVCTCEASILPIKQALFTYVFIFCWIMNTSGICWQWTSLRLSVVILKQFCLLILCMKFPSMHVAGNKKLYAFSFSLCGSGDPGSHLCWVSVLLHSWFPSHGQFWLVRRWRPSLDLTSTLLADQ